MYPKKYEIGDLLAFDAKVRSGKTEREACGENGDGLRAIWRRWVKAGRPEIWPVPKANVPVDVKIGKIARNTPKVISLDDLDRRLLQACWANCGKHPSWAKITLDLLKVLHLKYQDQKQENNVQLYIDGMRDLLEGKDDEHKGIAKD